MPYIPYDASLPARAAPEALNVVCNARASERGVQPLLCAPCPVHTSILHGEPPWTLIRRAAAALVRACLALAKRARTALQWRTESGWTSTRAMLEAASWKAAKVR